MSPTQGLSQANSYGALVFRDPAGPHFIFARNWLQLRVKHRFLQILVYNTPLKAPGSRDLLLVSTEIN